MNSLSAGLRVPRGCAVRNLCRVPVLSGQTPRPRFAECTRGSLLKINASAVETAEQSCQAEFVGVENDVYTVRGRLCCNVHADEMYRVLTSYDSCPSIFENIVSSQTIRGLEKTEVLQGCRWKFLMFSGKFDLLLEVEEEQGSRSVVFKLQQSAFMQYFEGRWQVLAAGEKSCVVEHVLAVKPAVKIPSAIMPHVQGIFVNQISTILSDLDLAVKSGLITDTAASN